MKAQARIGNFQGKYTVLSKLLKVEKITGNEKMYRQVPIKYEGKDSYHIWEVNVWQSDLMARRARSLIDAIS